VLREEPSFTIKKISSSSNGTALFCIENLADHHLPFHASANGMRELAEIDPAASSDSCIAGNGMGVIFTSVSTSPCFRSAAFSQR